MGYAVKRLIVAVVIALNAFPALAQDKPSTKDSAAIEKCMKEKTGHNWAWETCIGLVSEPCSKDEPSTALATSLRLLFREQAVWDNILNKSYQLLRERLEEDQVAKLRDMQRAWITSRDKTCGFLYDYFQGTMANPMIAACTSRATGMQALYLRGFADDVAERK